MRLIPLLLLASASVWSVSSFAQMADTGFHAFTPPTASASRNSVSRNGMTVYRPPNAAGGAETLGVSTAAGSTARSPDSPARGDDPYTQSLREPLRMPIAGEPLLPPPLTAKGLPLPPIPVAPGQSRAAALRPEAPLIDGPQINAYAPPTRPVPAATDTAAVPITTVNFEGIPPKARELIVDKYSLSPHLREAAIAFVNTNLAEWNQVRRSHKFSRAATRLSIEAQICLSSKIDHYAPDLAEGFTKEFKNALTATADLQQLYYDALQAAEYQEVIVDKDTEEACRDVGVASEGADIP